MDTVTLEVPEVWKELAEMVFAHSEKPPCKGKGSVPIHDPKPYQDDMRSVSVQLDEIYTFVLYLASGNMNYWAEYAVVDTEGHMVVDSEPRHHLDEGTEVKVKTDHGLFRIAFRFIEEPDMDAYDIQRAFNTIMEERMWSYSTLVFQLIRFLQSQNLGEEAIAYLNDQP